MEILTFSWLAFWSVLLSFSSFCLGCSNSRLSSCLEIEFAQLTWNWKSKRSDFVRHLLASPLGYSQIAFLKWLELIQAPWRPLLGLPFLYRRHSWKVDPRRVGFSARVRPIISVKWLFESSLLARSWDHQTDYGKMVKNSMEYQSMKALVNCSASY